MMDSSRNRIVEHLYGIDEALATYAVDTLTASADAQRCAALRVATLASIGAHNDGQFASQLVDALDVGLSPAELIEAMMHVIPYVGIPRPLNAILAAKGVFEDRSLLPLALQEPAWDETERMSVGLERIREAHPLATPLLQENLAPVAPSLYRYIVTAAFADMYGRPGLTYPQRQLLTLSSLTTQSGVVNHIRTHVHGALNIGLGSSDIIGAFCDVFPLVDASSIVVAVETAAEVFAERAVDFRQPATAWRGLNR